MYHNLSWPPFCEEQVIVGIIKMKSAAGILQNPKINLEVV